MTFLGREENPEKARIVLLPAPYDATVSYLPGTRFGPRKLLEASLYLEFYDEELECEAQNLPPILTLPEEELPLAPEKALKHLKERLTPHLKKGRFPVLLGGEHTISLAAIELLLNRYPELLVVQFDAHTDLRSKYQGSPWSHACVMRRAYEAGARIIALGVRALSQEEHNFAKKNQIPLFWARKLKESPAEVFSFLEKELRGFPLYVTIDLDALDPAELPGVGTPEPGGLSWYEMLSFLRFLAGFRVVGFDVVELLPREERSAFVAAKLVYKFLSYLFCPLS